MKTPEAHRRIGLGLCRMTARSTPRSTAIAIESTVSSRVTPAACTMRGSKRYWANAAQSYASRRPASMTNSTMARMITTPATARQG